ncbi:hypothetical protein Tco_1283428 [Tanacetum coccineum]
MPPTNNGSTEDIQPPVVPVVHHESISEPVNAPVSASRPNQKASIPFPSRRNDERRREKANDQIEKFYEIFRDLSFEISFTDALMLMPKFRLDSKNLNRKQRKGDDKLPVIIAKDLKNEEKAALIEVLKSHKRAIGMEYFLISGALRSTQSFVPTKFSWKRTTNQLWEDETSKSVKYQNSMTSFKKEVEKLLDADNFIHLHDSPAG